MKGLTSCKLLKDVNFGLLTKKPGPSTSYARRVAGLGSASASPVHLALEGTEGLSGRTMQDSFGFGFEFKTSGSTFFGICS